MIELMGSILHQWDVGRMVKISNKESVDEVHFARFDDAEALVVKPHEVDGSMYADIPNILLQTSRNITVYVVKEDVTLRCVTFQVMKRQKPADYVYTETEVLSYKMLDERIKALEEGGSEVSEEKIVEAVENYFAENPIETGATEEQARQIEKNAEDIRKLSEDVKNCPTPVQADWNQNDETALDYIKNRIGGYSAPVTETYKENEEFDFTASRTINLDVTGQDIFNVGDKIIITFDGVKYVSVGEYFKYNIAEMAHFGNKYVNFGTSSYEDTGEPFCFYKILSNPNTVTFRVRDNGVHTVSISKITGVETVKIPAEMVDLSKIDSDISNLSKEIEGIKENGTDGKDGISPIATVTQTDTGATISIQDVNGTTTANILHGKDGKDGEDGADYVLTEADKEEIAGMVEVPSGGSGGSAEADELLINFTVEEEVSAVNIPLTGLSQKINLANEIKFFIEFTLPSADDGKDFGKVGAYFYRTWVLATLLESVPCSPTNSLSYASQVRVISITKKSKDTLIKTTEYAVWRKNMGSSLGGFLTNTAQWENVLDSDVLKISSSLPIGVGTKIKLWVRGQL